ncbi:MAG: hypothetical protein CMB48_05900 [Euryarchaeota archaeon]|nr:hypothetical protein [Euryarchaeota archaeon]|tara:strand:+ start:11986 stop:13140 length:1155 start_codon:yes stop_codon:yes gene_type:complete
MGEISSMKSAEIEKVTLKSILKDLFAKERRGHIFSIIIFAPTLYILSQKSILSPDISAIAFLSLMSGYVITALMGLNEKTRPYLEKSTVFSENKKINSPIFKILNYIFSNMKMTAIPMFLSTFIFISLSLLMGENKPLSNVGEFLPILLAALFVFWSASQALSYKNSLNLWINNNIAIDNQETEFDSKKNTITQLIIVAIIVTIVSSIMLSYFGTGEDLNSTKGVPIIIILVSITQGFILWYSKDSREKLMKRKDGKKIEFVWGLALHLFASWHLLSVYRRLVSTDIDVFNVFEEIILMIFTVIMSIWAISSKGMTKNYNLFVSENVLFWGIAFAFGYAGSVTMLAVGLEGNISSIFAIGHFVTWITLMAMHKQSCKDFLTSRL